MTSSYDMLSSNAFSLAQPVTPGYGWRAVDATAFAPTAGYGAAIAFVAALFLASPPAAGSNSIIVRAVASTPAQLGYRNWAQATDDCAVGLDDVSPWVEALRNQFQLSDSVLAKLFQVKRQTVHNWRTGRNRPECPERVRALADALAEVDEKDSAYLGRVLFFPLESGELLEDFLSEEGWSKYGASGVRQAVSAIVPKAAQLRLRDERTLAALDKKGGVRQGGVDRHQGAF